MSSNGRLTDLVIASNRLPVRVSFDDGRLETESTTGGLAAALQGLRGSHDWIGWPGAVIPRGHESQVSKRLARDDLYPVFLSAEEEEDFYGRICNDSIWPL